VTVQFDDGKSAVVTSPVIQPPRAEVHLRGRSTRWRAALERAPGPSVSLQRWVLALIALDLLVGVAASAIGFESRFGSTTASVSGIPYWLLAATVGPLWVVVLLAGGAYDHRFLAIGAEEYRRVVNGGVWLTGAVAFAVFVLKVDLSRDFVAVTFPLLIALTLVGRYAGRRLLHRTVATGRPLYRTVMVGSTDVVRALRAHMDRVPWAGFYVVDVFGGDVTEIDIDELIGVVRRAHADTVAVAGRGAFRSGALRALSWRLEGTGIRLVVAPSVTDIAGPRIVVRPIDGLPLLMIEDPQMKGGRRVLKEVLDRALATAALVALSPLLLAAAIWIKSTSPGPVFYKQDRVGVGGRHFRMWKFRTMRVNADAEIGSLNPFNHAEGLLFKMRHDPRVTSAGRWIRRHSVDELPQLWNVLRGQMALVGPRPPLPSEVERYPDDVRRRLMVKPGMTGLWQIGGRTDLPWEEAVRLDLFYVENWSVLMDMMVLWKTLAVVVTGRGAY
jgi:exopolysaccharide biosynthesis polyprenyl glycosylphosphotransferase